MSSFSNLPYKIVLARPDGLSRSQLFVDFSSVYDRVPHPNSSLEQSIDEIWRQRTAGNPSLYNGTKFRYGGCKTLLDQDKSLQPAANCLCLGLTDYRTFVGTNLNAAWDQFLVSSEDDAEHCKHMSSPLGNGAIVETCDNLILMLERSHNVGEFPGHLVFPGGHSEPEELRISDHKDISGTAFHETLNSKISQEMFDGIIREVVEEVGVPASTLSDPIFIGISRRAVNVRPTAFFFMKCSLTSADILSFYTKAQDGFESTNLHILQKSELESAAMKMPGCHHGGFILYDLMIKRQESGMRSLNLVSAKILKFVHSNKC